MTSIIRAGIHGAGRARLRHALKNRLPFTTSGALRGETWTRNTLTHWDTGYLNDAERNRMMVDHMAGIAYVVWSYSTPIAWVLEDGTVYRVSQKFSATTSRHQGTLYLLDDA